MLRNLAMAILGLAALGGPLAAPVQAAPQKIHKNEELGFQFRPPRGWNQIDLQTDETYLAAKYRSDEKYFYTDPDLGYTFEHTPEVLCIAFLQKKEDEKKEKVEVTEKGDDEIVVKFNNPYKDYEDFLERTFKGGGWYVAEKEEGEYKKIPVTKYLVAVEKLERSGPKNIVTWIFHTDGIDFALQMDVLQSELRGLRKTIDSTLKSFEEIERKGMLVQQEAVSTVRFTRKDRNTADPKERRSVRMKSQKIEHEKAIASLTDDWSHEFYGDVLIMNKGEDKWAKRLGEHAEALIEWFEEELYFFGEGEFARAPIVRVFPTREERLAFTRGVITGTSGSFEILSPGEEIATNKDSRGWIGYEVNDFNRRLLLNWLAERDEDLANAVPTWLQGGMIDHVAGARLDGRKMDFRVSDVVRDYARLASAQSKATPPRELMRFTREEFQSEDGEANREAYINRRAESGMFVRFLLSNEARRCKQAKGLLEDYVRILTEVVEAVEKASEGESDEAPKTEEEEDNWARERAERWKAREKEIVETTFDRVFEGWSDKDWDKLHDAYFDFMGG